MPLFVLLERQRVEHRTKRRYWTVCATKRVPTQDLGDTGHLPCVSSFSMMKLTSFSSSSVAFACSRAGLAAAHAWNSRTRSSKALFISSVKLLVRARADRGWLRLWFAHSVGTQHLASPRSRTAGPRSCDDRMVGIVLQRCRWRSVVLAWSIVVEFRTVDG